jgi:predicted DNA-binding protein (MmcQ/YjbR family)
MDIEHIYQFAIGKPYVEECTPFGPDLVVFKVAGKIFLILPINESTVSINVKCNPEKAIELRERYPCVQPGYHMNKKHWNTISIDGSVSDRLIETWINDSYQLIINNLSKKERSSLLE